MYVSLGQARVLPRKVERKPGCGERPPWPVGPSQTVRRTGRCRGRSPSCCRRHQHRHRRRRRLHPLRPCTASRRPHAPTDLGNPGCTVQRKEATLGVVASREERTLAVQRNSLCYLGRVACLRCCSCACCSCSCNNCRFCRQ